MKKITKDASLHERTVQKIAAEQVAVARRVRSMNRRTSGAWSIKVDPRVWAVALELADGDALRIRVIHSTEVLVVNQRAHRGAVRSNQ